MQRRRLTELSVSANFEDISAVLDRINRDLTERVVTLVREILAKRGVEKPVRHDDDLTGSGLSSLDIVNLMLSVEAEFAITVPDREMTPSNFRTIEQTCALVESLLGKHG